MRRSLLLLACIVSPLTYAQFVNPLTFDGSKAQQDEVIQYIKDRVKETYCEGPVDMCQDATLRMMERQNLAAFKEVAKAKDKKILAKVIDTYCNKGINMCDYSTINMMYKQNLKASKQELSW